MRQIITLDQPLIYQIKISGQLSENWLERMEKMVVDVESESGGLPVTTMTGAVDQAALLGLLRRLYYLGLPLISVNCIQSHKKENN